MEIDYVTCPKCKCKNWNDIPNTYDLNKTKFRCVRCSYLVSLGTCAKCKTKDAWILTHGIEKNGSHNPIYRFKCKTCGREVGVLIDRQ